MLIVKLKLLLIVTVIGVGGPPGVKPFPLQGAHVNGHVAGPRGRVFLRLAHGPHTITVLPAQALPGGALHPCAQRVWFVHWGHPKVRYLTLRCQIR